MPLPLASLLPAVVLIYLPVLKGWIQCGFDFCSTPSLSLLTQIISELFQGFRDIKALEPWSSPRNILQSSIRTTS